MPELVPLAKLQDYVGQEMGVSDWLQVKQDRVNQFADCTEDHQWIHVDPEKAKLGPFGGPIAHGFLTLSLLVKLSGGMRVIPAGTKMAINYGLNKVRFLTPVKVGAKIRNRSVLKEVQQKEGGRVLMAFENTIEIEGEAKPALVAETLTMFFT